VLMMHTTNIQKQNTYSSLIVTMFVSRFIYSS